MLAWFSRVRIISLYLVTSASKVFIVFRAVVCSIAKAASVWLSVEVMGRLFSGMVVMTVPLLSVTTSYWIVSSSTPESARAALTRGAKTSSGAEMLMLDGSSSSCSWV